MKSVKKEAMAIAVFSAMMLSYQNCSTAHFDEKNMMIEAISESSSPVSPPPVTGTPISTSAAFWISMDDPQQIDKQVARLLADFQPLAIPLRMPDGEPGQNQENADLKMQHAVWTVKSESPQTAVLMYTWATRNIQNRNGSAGVMDWLTDSSGMLIPNTKCSVDKDDGKSTCMGDVTRADYQEKVAIQVANAVRRRGFDGVALDMSVHRLEYMTPIFCTKYAAYCDAYPTGLDATFAAIRRKLGNKIMNYNGLWNFNDGSSVIDQAKLFQSADIASVEYFGGKVPPPKSVNSNRPMRNPSFTLDILPFLQQMAVLPDDKKMFLFGRASDVYTYSDYEDDFLRQRYLYAAFLLGARQNTFFKYHSTFQMDDPPPGRTGGMSVYSDWALAKVLGDATEAYHVNDGIYSRSFINGLVLVAPDDGSGGSYDLPSAMYSPEGVKYEGHLTLQPAQGLLLFNTPLAETAVDQHLLDLHLLADWPKVTLTGSGADAEMTLLDGAPAGSHDMLLDPVRSRHPARTLQINVQAKDATTKIQLVAEVDDPKGVNSFVVLEVDAKGQSAPTGPLDITFRLSQPHHTHFPVIQVPQKLIPGTWQTISLNGPGLFEKSGTGLVFKRWVHANFIGEMKLHPFQLLK